MPRLLVLVLAVSACAREAPPEAPPPSADSAQTAEPASATDTVVAARADLRPVGGSGVRGAARFEPFEEGVRVEVRAEGLREGLHGLHVHAASDCAEAATSGHFDPSNAPHGNPEDPRPLHHAGDLGNLHASEDGARLDRVFTDLRLDGPASVAGRVLVVHAGQDDLNTQPDGDAGPPVACGVIETVR